jgi:hypothetical protein
MSATVIYPSRKRQWWAIWIATAAACVLLPIEFDGNGLAFDSFIISGVIIWWRAANESKR